MKRINTVWFLLTAIILFPSIAFSRPLSSDEELKILEICTKDAKEEVIQKKKQFTGKLEGFVWGDLFHSEVRNINGEIESFSSSRNDSCFLALHKDEWLDIRYELMCQVVPGYGQYVPANVITQIYAKKIDYLAWINRTGGNNDKCEKLVEKFTRQ